MSFDHTLNHTHRHVRTTPMQCQVQTKKAVQKQLSLPPPQNLQATTKRRQNHERQRRENPAPRTPLQRACQGTMGMVQGAHKQGMSRGDLKQGMSQGALKEGMPRKWGTTRLAMMTVIIRVSCKRKRFRGFWKHRDLATLPRLEAWLMVT